MYCLSPGVVVKYPVGSAGVPPQVQNVESELSSAAPADEPLAAPTARRASRAAAAIFIRRLMDSSKSLINQLVNYQRPYQSRFPKATDNRGLEMALRPARSLRPSRDAARPPG